MIDAFQDREVRATTGPKGTFAVASPRRRLEGTLLVARTVDATRLGTFRYGYELSRDEAEAPARIVLKRPREIVVHVTDAKQAPVPGAGVEAVGGYTIIADATTDANGQARLLLPVEVTPAVMWIFALKSGLGFDYAEYGKIDEAGRNQGAAPVSELPAEVGLTLDGARTARIKAVDRDDKPLAGVSFAPWLLRKNGRRSHFNSSSRITQAVTGADGIAPSTGCRRTARAITFWPRSEDFVHRRVVLAEDETQTVTARLIRTETIRGKVVYPDGSPAAGIEVKAYGTGVGMDHGQARVLTEADGTYEMNVGPDEAYAVYVDDKDWAARSRLDVVVRQGQSVEHVDFPLTRGTILRGTVTIGPDDRPAVGHSCGSTRPASGCRRSFVARATISRAWFTGSGARTPTPRAIIPSGSGRGRTRCSDLPTWRTRRSRSGTRPRSSATSGCRVRRRGRSRAAWSSRPPRNARSPAPRSRSPLRSSRASHSR